MSLYDGLAGVGTMREQHWTKREHPLAYISLFNRHTYSVKRKIHTDMFLFKLLKLNIYRSESPFSVYTEIMSRQYWEKEKVGKYFLPHFSLSKNKNYSFVLSAACKNPQCGALLIKSLCSLIKLFSTVLINNKGLPHILNTFIIAIYIFTVQSQTVILCHFHCNVWM